MFTYPIVLTLLSLIPLFLIFFIIRGVARAAALQRIGDSELVRSLLSQVSPARRRWKSFLWLCSLAMLILALARPIWGIQSELVRTQGVQVVLALDISRSMNAQDVAPSRMQRMIFDMLDLVNQLEGNDVGIVVFAGDSYVYMPMTYDTGATRVFLSNISSDMTTVQGTNIAAAIESALSMFDSRTSAQPVIVMASDGENHEIDPENIAQVASENNIIIHTIGYGTEEGGLIPIYDQFGNLYNYASDNNDELITSILNADTLRRISQATGGIYQQAGVTNAVTTLAENIAQLESGELREELVTRPVERFGIFVALAILLLSIEILLPETQEKKV
ncbi:MAG: VWA domain-containing protein [Anaerolineae bacterium]|nr:VWA domain-containing protein [Anaerolineae bacterium]MDQ7034592.1 VWA domain-containing protein [Anaerolineae bacterium]